MLQDAAAATVGSPAVSSPRITEEIRRATPQPHGGQYDFGLEYQPGGSLASHPHIAYTVSHVAPGSSPPLFSPQTHVISAPTPAPRMLVTVEIWPPVDLKDLVI